MLYFYHVNNFCYMNNVESGFIVGRTTGDLIIPDSGLSGKHAQFIIEQDGNDRTIYVIDLGSKNRTSVNRTEIMPNTKVRLQDGALVEFGGQAFIITSSKNLTFEKVNALLDTHRSKPIVKLEGVKAVFDLKERIKEEVGKLAGNEIALQTEINNREASIQQVMQEMLSLDKNLEAEFRKMEETKARMIAEVQEQKNGLNDKVKAIRSEIAVIAEKKNKITAEIEKKKVKFSGTKIPGME